MENNQQAKILYRSVTNRVILGVCGGLGEYFNIDPIIFRLIFILLSFGGGSGIILYIILAFLIPKAQEEFNPDLSKIDIKEKAEELVSEIRDMKERRIHKHHNRSASRLIFGLVFLIIGFLFLIQNFNLFPGLFDVSTLLKFWPVLIIFAGLSLISRGARHL